MSQFVTLINRSTKVLKGTWNGRQYDIAPGKHEFPELQAMKFREQNPIMGTEDPYTSEKQYLIGIVEHGNDTSPIEQSTAITLQNITEKLASGEYKLVRASGIYNPSVDKTAPMSTELAFVKP